MYGIKKDLLSMAESGYRDFQARLMPTVDKSRILGVRTPKLRAFAKRLKGTGEAEAFTASLPHEFFEEDNLHAFLIEQISDFKLCRDELRRFLPYVDNWATCDSMTPRVFGKRENREALSAFAMELIASPQIYAVRYGVGILMKFFLDEDFSPRYPEAVASIKRDEYYIKMMIAWYFATALAKQYDVVLPFLTKRRLDPWIHGKTIQKALESFRIDAEKKEYLRGLRNEKGSGIDTDCGACRNNADIV